ncbi:MAG: Zn-ribbon domain-containing OB-fold protein [Candidatus Heimdallarchaeota archaeon]|nr:Zn-ribbon domain-containing OB-fold protein [Candidatus Heimdallarchaeota archaeon]
MEPPKIWREKRQRYLGTGIECSDCNNKNFPFTDYCPNCGSEKVEEYKLAERGKIVQFSQVNQTAEEMTTYVPYAIGIIELEDGIKVTGQIVDIDYSQIKVGLHVRMVLRILAKDGEEGLIKYGFKFVPVD